MSGEDGSSSQRRILGGTECPVILKTTAWTRLTIRNDVLTLVPQSGPRSIESATIRIGQWDLGLQAVLCGLWATPFSLWALSVLWGCKAFYPSCTCLGELGLMWKERIPT